MKQRKMGQSDIRLSALGVGCWVMGGDWFGGETLDGESVKAIHAALDAGANFIDTAELYGDGHSEQVVGRALQGRKREEAVLSSKVWKSNMRYNDVFTACEGSLKRMGTDYIDLYFIHYPPEVCEVEETMEAMLTLKKQGKIREIGLSNFNVPQMERAMKVGRFEVIQPCHSLFWRFADVEIIPWCIGQNVGVVTYSPLAQGLLTGKYAPGHQFAPDDARANAPLFKGENFAKALAAVEKLRPIAEKYGKTVGQLAIAWDNATPGVTSTIVGARNAGQMAENLAGENFTLSPEDYVLMEKIGKGVTDGMPPYASFFSDELVGGQ